MELKGVRFTIIPFKVSMVQVNIPVALLAGVERWTDLTFPDRSPDDLSMNVSGYS
jgi:hypothetical protein